MELLFWCDTETWIWSMCGCARMSLESYQDSFRHWDCFRRSLEVVKDFPKFPGLGKLTVDRRNPVNHLGWWNNGINYQPQLVSLPDFWLPSTVSITFLRPWSRCQWLRLEDVKFFSPSWSETFWTDTDVCFLKFEQYITVKRQYFSSLLITFLP